MSLNDWMVITLPNRKKWRPLGTSWNAADRRRCRWRRFRDSRLHNANAHAFPPRLAESHLGLRMLLQLIGNRLWLTRRRRRPQMRPDGTSQTGCRMSPHPAFAIWVKLLLLLLSLIIVLKLLMGFPMETCPVLAILKKKKKEYIKENYQRFIDSFVNDLEIITISEQDHSDQMYICISMWDIRQ